MGRIICLDYGEARIGVAVSDPSQIIASPLRYINARQEGVTDDILSLIDEYNADKLVIGLPLNLKGRNSEKTREVKEFYNEIKEILSIPVELWDERFSTVTAEKALRQGNIKAKKQRHIVDSLSAQIILQNYLDYLKYQ